MAKSRFIRLKTTSYESWWASKSAEEKELYKESIVFDASAGLIWTNDTSYGIGNARINSIDTAVSAINAVKSVKGNTGSYTAASGNEELNIKGDGTIISTSLDTSTLTISADLTSKDISIGVNSSDETYAKVYTFYQGGTDAAHTIGTINIPKDMVVSSGEVSTLTAETATEAHAAGTYLILTLANATNDKIWIPTDSLVEYVTSGSSVTDAINVSINASHQVTASVKEGSLTTEMLDSSVQTALGKANSALQSISIDSSSANYAEVGAIDANKDQAIKLKVTTLETYKDNADAADALASAKDVYQTIIDNEYITSTSLNDLNTRLELLEDWEEV